MTVVEDFGEYTGLEGALTVGVVPIADVAFDLKWTRGSINVPRSGKYSDKELPGKFSVTITLKKVLVKTEAATVIGKSLNATPVGGTAGVMHAGLTPPGSGSENITDMTSATPATPSRIRFIARTAAVTAVGRAIIIGTDRADREMTENVDLAVCIIGATSGTSKGLFKTVSRVALVDVVAAGATIEVSSITGASNYTVGQPEVFDLIGSLTKGAHSVTATLPDCWFKNGGIDWTDASKAVDVNINVGIYDPDLMTVAVV